MNYAVVIEANNSVTCVKQYSNSDWESFKANYEATHPGKLLVLIQSSTFPIGHNWSKETDGYYPHTPEYTLAEAKTALIDGIMTKTESLQYSGTFTYDGHQFSRSHDAQDHFLQLRSIRNDLPPEAFPVYVPQVDVPGGFTALSSASDIVAICAPLIEVSLSMWNSCKALVDEVNAMTTISEAVNFVDTRH